MRWELPHISKVITFFLEDQEQNGDGQNMYLDHFAAFQQIGKDGTSSERICLCCTNDSRILILKSAIYEEMF